jgi:hypothetical protein
MKIINEVLFINKCELYPFTLKPKIKKIYVAVKERSNISPFTLSPIVAAPTVIDTISQSYLQQFNIQQFGVPYKQYVFVRSIPNT